MLETFNHHGYIWFIKVGTPVNQIFLNLHVAVTIDVMKMSR